MSGPTAVQVVPEPERSVVDRAQVVNDKSKPSPFVFVPIGGVDGRLSGVEELLGGLGGLGAATVEGVGQAVEVRTDPSGGLHEGLPGERSGCRPDDSGQAAGPTVTGCEDVHGALSAGPPPPADNPGGERQGAGPEGREEPAKITGLGGEIGVGSTGELVAGQVDQLAQSGDERLHVASSGGAGWAGRTRR